jgi:hypothetical protein
MGKSIRPGKLALSIVATLLVAPAFLSAQARAGSTVVDGTITAVSAGGLTMSSTDGKLTKVTIGDNTLILAREAATLDSIKPGDALGVAARRDSNGALIANGINIFSTELWNRVRKGQFPMQSGDIMTNAVVTQAETRVDGRVITMKVDERSQAITVPAGTQIHRLVTERLADLTPGMHVVVRGAAGDQGVVAATTVNYELPPRG